MTPKANIKINCICIVSNKQIDIKVSKYHFYNIKMKYLGMHLIKCVQEPYIKHYKTLLREMKEDLNMWKYALRSRIRRLNIVMMSILIYRFNEIPTKSKWALSQKLTR